jgi:hypothetical protein
MTYVVQHLRRWQKKGRIKKSMLELQANNYVVIDVTLTNLNKNDLYMSNPLYFRLNMYDGAAYSFSSLSGVLLNNTLERQFHTNPGDKVIGAGNV